MRGTAEVVLVDDADREVGRASLAEAHRGPGAQHRAFTAVLFDERGDVILARRAAGKPLWPGWWDATVASHPRAGEGYREAGGRRLEEELGVRVELWEPGAFRYHACWDERGSERELCAALIGVLDGEPVPHPDEISELRSVSLRELVCGVEPDVCPWAWLALEVARRHLSEAPAALRERLAPLELQLVPTELARRIDESGCTWSAV